MNERESGLAMLYHLMAIQQEMGDYKLS